MEESFNAQEIARFIDHTLLKPEATPAQIAALCAEASQYQFASVCVNPTYVRLCAQQLASSAVKVCTVIGFPLGAHLTEVKVFEAQKALQDGALELDMVINIGALKAGKDQLVGEDIQQVVKTSHAAGGLVKVIIETALLSEEEKVRACRLAQEAGADFVKTSTGFSHGGATLEDVALMRRVVGPQMGVKAAGGVRSYQDAISMIRAGATRIGTSSGVAIVLGAPQPYR